MTEQVDLAEGRNCDGCTLCCKLLSIEELSKPPLVWCTHCDAKTGCKTYPDRPTECRDFYCQYLLDPALDDRWKPSRCKLVVVVEEHANAIVIHADPARPDAWREEPFYSRIRQWAVAAAQRQGQVIVWQGDSKIVISPEGREDFGAVKPDQRIAASDALGH